MAEVQNRMGSVIEILITKVLAHHAQGNLSLAVTTLERVLTLAEPEGYLRIFVNEGEPMRMILSDLHLHIEKRSGGQGHQLLGYVNKLLTAFPQSETKALSKSTGPKSDLIESLNERELKILQLIAQGLSNREISERLFLALSTVKGHNRNIFNKLHVQSRTEAIARSRELGLL
jgi:LuxR family maltose regulon positive regulatory protein